MERIAMKYAMKQNKDKEDSLMYGRVRKSGKTPTRNVSTQSEKDNYNSQKAHYIPSCKQPVRYHQKCRQSLVGDPFVTEESYKSLPTLRQVEHARPTTLSFHNDVWENWAFPEKTGKMLIQPIPRLPMQRHSCFSDVPSRIKSERKDFRRTNSLAPIENSVRRNSLFPQLTEMPRIINVTPCMHRKLKTPVVKSIVSPNRIIRRDSLESIHIEEVSIPPINVESRFTKVVKKIKKALLPSFAIHQISKTAAKPFELNDNFIRHAEFSLKKPESLSKGKGIISRKTTAKQK